MGVWAVMSETRKINPRVSYELIRLGNANSLGTSEGTSDVPQVIHVRRALTRQLPSPLAHGCSMGVPATALPLMELSQRAALW